MPKETVQTLIKLLLKEQFDQDQHCLLVSQYFLDKSSGKYNQ